MKVIGSGASRDKGATPQERSSFLVEGVLVSTIGQCQRRYNIADFYRAQCNVPTVQGDRGDSASRR